MPNYVAPHTLAVKAIKRFAGQWGISVKQAEILMSIYEFRYIAIDDLAEIAEVRLSTLRTHLYELYRKRWLNTHPKELDMISLTKDNREDLARTMHFIHKDLRHRLRTFKDIAEVEEELA